MPVVETPKVSMVVPTFNQVQYLGACLDSIYFQDHPNLEIIVVNDCSTDGTREFLEQFVHDVALQTVSYASNWNEETNEIERTTHHRYPRAGRELVVLHNEENLGSTKTYNRGFRECSGRYCTYIASDDLCHPSMVSSMLEILEGDEVDFVYSDMFIIDDGGRILREFKQPDYSFEACFFDWYRCGVSKLYRRELHDRIGFYDEAFLANDHELYLRFAKAGVRFRHIPNTLYSVRSHENRGMNVHSDSNWARLLDESRSLVADARAVLRARDE